MSKLAAALATVGVLCIGWSMFANAGERGHRKAWYE